MVGSQSGCFVELTRNELLESNGYLKSIICFEDARVSQTAFILRMQTIFDAYCQYTQHIFPSLILSENEQRESLISAIQEGDQDVVDLLRGDSALLDAAKKGNLSRVQKLLTQVGFNALCF